MNQSEYSKWPKI